MPVDWDVRFIDDVLFSMPAGHVSHFPTCKNPEQFRKPVSAPIYDSNDEGPILKKLAEIPGKHHDSPGLFDDEIIG